jgi:putative ABC transport system permease protein
LIACANVANLSLVRASGRHQEIAIRNALGARRGRVVRQLLTESLLLSLLGTAVALPLGWAGVRLLTADQTLHFPRVNVIALNSQVLAFTLGVGLLVGILVGLAPALQASSLQVNEELKTSAQAVVGSPRGWRLLRDSLVVGEIAIALALLVGAGLVLHSFVKLLEVELGVHPEGVMTAHIVLPPKKYSTLAQRRAFFDQLEQNLSGAHGVRAAAVGVALPLEGGMFQRISVNGRESPGANGNYAAGNAVTEDFFRAFGIPFLRGRNFTPQEIESVSESIAKAQGKPVQLVAIINQKMARQYWPDQDPVGRMFSIDGNGQATIVGVVGDTLVWPGAPMIPQAYYPLPWGLNIPNTPMSIVVKGTADTGALAATVRQQVRALDDSLALYKVRTVQEVLADSLSWATSQTRLLTTFALLALALTAVGIYGVMAYAVTQRTHEIGLRMALGAGSREIFGLVMRQGARITILGVAIGLACAWALTRFLANLLFGVKVHDPATFVVVAGLLAAIALLASYIPARRATKVDPMVALRYE